VKIKKMTDSIKLLKLGWKGGFAVLTAIALFAFGLVANINSALATNPNLTLKYLVAHNNVGTWDDNVSVGAGETITLYAEIHNTNVPTTANNVKIVANLPSTTGTSTATASADNAASVNESVQINVSGGNLEYVAGSTLMTWDVDGDGNNEYDNTQMPDGIVGSGLTIGDQQGCNEYIIQISFLARVVEQSEPSPSPSPSPSLQPPCDDCGGDQEQEQNQDVDVNVEQNNNQTVNISNPAPPAVSGAKIPFKQPETGVSVLGLTAIGGAAPLGFALSRFGRGRLVGKREDESLSEFASGIMSRRFGKNKHA
jgi:hypothetical protein